MTESQLRDAIAAHRKSLYGRGYAHGSSGNLGARVADSVLVRPTGSSLGRLDPARLLLMGLLCGAINDAIAIYGRLQPIVATTATGAI
jgi:ribulose-5-phosphate 4-epimerase/fuculose-1-phosphate aldolase